MSRCAEVCNVAWSMTLLSVTRAGFFQPGRGRSCSGQCSWSQLGNPEERDKTLIDQVLSACAHNMWKHPLGLFSLYALPHPYVGPPIWAPLMWAPLYSPPYMPLTHASYTVSLCAVASNAVCCKVASFNLQQDKMVL